MTEVLQKDKDLRKRLSIELCDNFTQRLKPEQKYEIKVGALIAIKNLIKESKINDQILMNFLTDTISDPSSNIRDLVIRIIMEIAEDKNLRPEINELLKIKLNEVNPEIKKEITKLQSCLV